MSNESRPTAAATEKPSAASPVIIDLGKKSKKQVKQLRKGKPGKLLDQVREAVETLRAEGAIEANAQPVVIVVRERAEPLGWRGF